LVQLLAAGRLVCNRLLLFGLRQRMPPRNCIGPGAHDLRMHEAASQVPG